MSVTRCASGQLLAARSDPLFLAFFSCQYPRSVLVVNLLQLVVILFLVAHWMCCVWFSFGYHPGGWVDRDGLVEIVDGDDGPTLVPISGNLVHEWLSSFYWSITTMTTIRLMIASEIVGASVAPARSRDRGARKTKGVTVVQVLCPPHHLPLPPFSLPRHPFSCTGEQGWVLSR